MARTKKWLLTAGLLLPAGFPTGSTHASPSPPFRFVEVSSRAEIGPYFMPSGQGGGVAAADFDDDGFVDLFVPNGDERADQLYRNLGNGRFEEIAEDAGLATIDASRCGLWFDDDGDGDLDLLAANDTPGAPTTFRLYRQSARLAGRKP